MLLRKESSNWRIRSTPIAGTVASLLPVTASKRLITSAPRAARRAVGTQKGHPGHALELTDHPDKVVVHEVTECRCGACLADQPPESFERRQMVDLPPLKSEVTEHRAEQKTCHICGAVCKAVFPDDVNQPMQYGPQIRSLASYLNQYQLLPYNRVGEFFKDLFGQSFSEGSLFTANQDIYEALAGYEQDVPSVP
jgi:transposase